MDGIPIFGQDQEEHDARLHAALGKIQEAGAMLHPVQIQQAVPHISGPHHQSAWYIPLSQQACSSLGDGDAHVPHRIEAIYGDGESVR